MKLHKFSSKLIVSFSLMLALVTVFSLRSLAANQAGDNTVEQGTPVFLFVQEVTGALTGTGSITVNGNAAQSGMTIMTGSTIATGSNGNATIDLGSLGRVTLRPDTTITLTLAPGMVDVKAQCEHTKIEVTRGQVEVRSPRMKTLNAGEDETFDGTTEISTTGADFIVACVEKRPGAIVPILKGGAYTGPGLIGLLALIGIGAGIATGIAIGDEPGGVLPIVSPNRP